MSQPVAIVTGSAGSLGGTIADTLAEAGYAVVGYDLPAAVRRLADGRSLPDRVTIPGDVTSAGDLADLVEHVDATYGRLDLLVNNAATDAKVTGSAGEPVDPVDAFSRFAADAFLRTLETNVVGPFLVVQACLDLLRRTPRANIVNIASIYGLRAPNHALYRDSGTNLFKSPDYPASKAALISFTEYLAATLGQVGIRANAVSPGGVDLGLPQAFVDEYSKGTPLSRMASPEDVAAAVLFVGSADAGYLTGHNLVVDGGRTIW